MSKHYDAVKTACRRYSGYLERISVMVFEFSRTQKFDKEFDKLVLQHFEIIKDLPENWLDMSRAEYCFGKIFSSTVILRKFIRAQCDFLEPEDLEITKGFLTDPWEYNIFSATMVEESFVYAVDSLSGDEFLLESPTTAALEAKGNTLFWGLLFYNGECYQSYGIVNYSRALKPVDFDYFARNLNHNLWKVSGVSSVFARYPVPFFVLITFAESPATYHGKEEFRYCASSNTIPGFEVNAVEGFMNQEQAGPVVKFDFSDPQKPVCLGNLYVNTRTSEVLLVASSLKRFHELQELLPYDFDGDPDIQASVLMVIATEKILGAGFPGSDYDRLFSTEAAGEDKKELSSLNQALAEVMRDINSGSEPDYRSLAEKYGLDEDSLRQIVAGVRERIDAASPFDDDESG